EIEEKQYQERKNQIKALEAEIDDLLFLTPHSLQEIIQEGSILRHCVGSQHYIERHTQGKTTIVFIRRKEKPDMPYFTLEYRNQQVIQIQGKCNRQEVPKKIKQAVRQWQENLQHALSS
ncbi:PcfJ domain-containing protein, partial [Enterococcus faecalis]